MVVTERLGRSRGTVMVRVVEGSSRAVGSDSRSSSWGDERDLLSNLDLQCSF